MDLLDRRGEPAVAGLRLGAKVPDRLVVPVPDPRTGASGATTSCCWASSKRSQPGRLAQVCEGPDVGGNPRVKRGVIAAFVFGSGSRWPPARSRRFPGRRSPCSADPRDPLPEPSEAGSTSGSSASAGASLTKVVLARARSRDARLGQGRDKVRRALDRVLYGSMGGVEGRDRVLVAAPADRLDLVVCVLDQVAARQALLARAAPRTFRSSSSLRSTSRRMSAATALAVSSLTSFPKVALKFSAASMMTFMSTLFLGRKLVGAEQVVVREALLRLRRWWRLRSPRPWRPPRCFRP